MSRLTNTQTLKLNGSAFRGRSFSEATTMLGISNLTVVQSGATWSLAYTNINASELHFSNKKLLTFISVEGANTATVSQ